MAFLSILLNFCLSSLVGGFLTWLAGRFLDKQELTFANSVGLNATMYILNPFVPALYILFEYYIGSGSILPGLAPDRRIFIGLCLALVLSIGMWYAVLKYIFGWNPDDSTLFCCAQGCIVALLYLGLVLLLVLLAVGLTH